MSNEITTPGLNYVKISQGEIWTGYEFEAVIPSLVSLRVTTPPNKLSYELGEEFDPEGLVLTGTYNNGDIKEITHYEISGFDSSLPTTCCPVTFTCDDCSCSVDTEILRCLYLYDIINSEYVVLLMYYGHDKIVKVPSTIEGLPVREIEVTCFNYSYVEKVTIPTSVQKIF